MFNKMFIRKLFDANKNINTSFKIGYRYDSIC